MSYKDLPSLLDDVASRFTDVMAKIHATGRSARVVLTGGTAGTALLARLVDKPIDLSLIHI